jgi:hypothetical protein
MKERMRSRQAPRFQNQQRQASGSATHTCRHSENYRIPSSTIFCRRILVGNALQKVRMPHAVDATSTQTRNCSAARRSYMLHVEYMRTIVCWGFKLSSWGCYIACSYYIAARTILSSPCLQPTGSSSTLIKTTAPTGLRGCPTVLDVRMSSAVGLDGLVFLLSRIKASSLLPLKFCVDGITQMIVTGCRSRDDDQLQMHLRRIPACS